MDESDLVFVQGNPQPVPEPEPDGGIDVLEGFVDLKIPPDPDVVAAQDIRSQKPKENSPVFQYLSNFHRLFGTIGTDERLRNLAYSYFLRPGGFRGLCWSYWLSLVPGADPVEWPRDWHTRRTIYSAYKSKHCHDNRCDPTFDPSVNNPLSQVAESPWNVYFMNADLKKEIERDVVRTCPGNDVFKDDQIRTMMINILFIYCKEHQPLTYKQGMHELLGSILLVWKGDVETCTRMLRTQTSSNGATAGDRFSSVLLDLMDANFIEHDTYFIFEKVMDHMWDWYYSSDRPPGQQLRRVVLKQPQAPFVSPGEIDDHTHCNAIRRLRNMWTNILQLHDQDLFDHLEALYVLPTTFGINWTKLLFSRQFKAYLSLWDAILASKFTLVDYLVVAMVLAIRPMLLSGDSNQCNSLLVSRYPTNVRVDYVISLGLHLQDSFKFSKPRGSPFQPAREEKPATELSPQKDSDDTDPSTGGFDLLSREECSPRFSPSDVALRDTLETIDASLNELRHALQQQQAVVGDNVMNAFQRLEDNIQAMGRQISSRQPDRPNLRRNNYSVAFDALGWIDCETPKDKKPNV